VLALRSNTALTQVDMCPHSFSYRFSLSALNLSV
jgi:hypothetical protein